MLIGLRVELTSNPLNQQQDGPISSELDSLPAAPSSSLQAWRKLYYEPATAVQRYQSLFDDTKPQPGSPLERIQFEILSRLQQQQQNTWVAMRGGELNKEIQVAVSSHAFLFISCTPAESAELAARASPGNQCTVCRRWNDKCAIVSATSIRYLASSKETSNAS